MAKKKKTEKKAPAETAETNRLTIYDYEQRYSKHQNERGAKFALRLIAALIGIIIFVCLLFIALQVYGINRYAGYAAGGVCLILFIFLYIVPAVKLLHTGYFETNVNAMTAREAKKHNRKLRHEIADKIIDLTASVEGAGWYDSELVGKLAIAMNTHNEEDIKNTLTELYKGSVKKTAKDLIFKSSLRSATYSAISQTAKVDTLLVAFINIQLVKDLVYLYGFRPSDARLVKIFARVLQNSLIAYGLGGMNLGQTVVQTMGSAVKGIPILGTAIAAVVDSSVQGLANGTLTTVIGYQTIKYLNTEYRLQNILDGVDVSETPVELEEACTELETQLKKKKKISEAV